jgi:hypothetical protein
LKFLAQITLQRFFHRNGAPPPVVVGLSQFYPFVVDEEVNGLGGGPFQDDDIIACVLQLGAEEATMLALA